MPYDTIESLYKHLDPSSAAAGAATSPVDLSSIVAEMILSPNGTFHTSTELYAEINKHFTAIAARAQKDALISLFSQFQIITTDANPQELTGGGILSNKDMYWRWSIDDETAADVTKIGDIVIGLDADLKNKKIAVINTRGAFQSPATRGASNIDLFLNYTPPIVAAQLVPFFDVEFKFIGASANYLNTPSPLRFLMGSKATYSANADTLSPADAILRDDAFHHGGGDSAKDYSVTGMEMFLMPQTLTNMDSLNPVDSGAGISSTRLVRAKPFLPFASIESFDVHIANAGAGKFSHKTANLKLKVHDKARISELSQFIRGSSGFNETIIWTTYGWLAPRNRGTEDDYSRFINENMLMREGWSVVNSQYSFDASGQVSINLSLVSQALKALQDISVSETTAEAKKFHRVIQAIADAKRELSSSDNKFSISLESEQILNAGSTSGVFANFKNVKSQISNLITSLRTGGLTAAALQGLEDNLATLTGKEYSSDQVNLAIGRDVQARFEKLSSGLDPFLPRADSNLFSAELVKTITDFSSKEARAQRVAFIKASEAKAKKEVGSLSLPEIETEPVVSFGKLFLNFLLSSYAISSSVDCDELQIIFYSMNDQCGPISNHSISEFPIDVIALAHGYAEHIKSVNVDALDLQSFLKLVINTQFSDQRAIGYGMNRFFNPQDPEKPRGEQTIAKGSEIEKGYAEWLSNYGSFKPPVLEIYIETGESGSSRKNIIGSLKAGVIKQSTEKLISANDKSIIKRIHIYDKQCNPYRLAQQIIDGGSDYEVGQINSGKLKGLLTTYLENKSAEELKKIREALQSKDAAASSTAIAATGIQQLEIVDKPAGATVKIPKNRIALKEALMKNTPTISIGSNGTLVTGVNVASKTDGLMGSINIMNAAKGQAKGTATVSDNGLEGVGGLPMRSTPVQLTMSTLGVPTAQLYQTFFIDFNTGTSLDNIYGCTQINHSMTQGKFITSWTFMPSEKGYGKFSAPPAVNTTISKKLLSMINEKLDPKPDPKK